MEWPSKTVPQGGLFQPARVKYSPETKEFLNILMNESKMTMMQRKKVDYSLRVGKSLPNFEEDDDNTARPSRFKKEKMTVRPGTSKRRMFNTIVNSGAYERDKFKPQHPKVDREMAKKHLQDIMSYGKELKSSPKNNRKTKPKPQTPKPVNRYDQLKQEIEEREDFLAEMEKLGEADKHRLVIQQQIQARLREIEKLRICDSPPPEVNKSKTSKKK